MLSALFLPPTVKEPEIAHSRSFGTSGEAQLREARCPHLQSSPTARVTQSVLSVKRGTRSFRAEGFACDHFIRTVSSLGIDRRREMLSIGHVLTACTGCTSATSANNTGKTNILGFGNVAILLVENTSTRSALPPMQAMRQLLSVPRTRVRNVAAKRKPPLCQSVFDVPKCTAVNANRRR